MNLFEQYMKNATKFLGEEFEEEDEEVGSTFGDEDLEVGPEEPEDMDDLALDGEELDGEFEEEELTMPCPDCDGEGVDEEGNECETCGGTGEVEQEFDFDPEEGVCPCCGCKLNLVEPEEDEEDLDDEELEGDEEELEDEDLEELEDEEEEEE